jgi:phosphatidylglycerophosphatase A
MSRVALTIATVGYVGLMPIAPGTWGTAAGLLIFAALRAVAPPVADVAAILLTFVVGTWAADVAERHFDRKDPGPVVVDEVLGTFITMALLPASLSVGALGFFLFRVFDVIKPFPAGRLEAIPGGLGVMLDDAMAGVYAHLVLRLTLTMMPGWFS